MKETCAICHGDGGEHALRHVNLYISGSEGLEVCHNCEMEIVEYVRGKMREYWINRREEFKKKRALRPK